MNNMKLVAKIQEFYLTNNKELLFCDKSIKTPIVLDNEVTELMQNNFISYCKAGQTYYIHYCGEILILDQLPTCYWYETGTKSHVIYVENAKIILKIIKTKAEQTIVRFITDRVCVNHIYENSEKVENYTEYVDIIPAITPIIHITH